MAALDIAAAFIEQEEGYSSAPYRDSGGVPTIGYGTTVIAGDPVTMSTPACTQAQAQAWLETDMQSAYTAVINGVTAPATDNQIAAFVSFAYNEGNGAFLGSTLLKDFNAGDIAGCEAQFGNWVYVTEGGKLVQVAGLVNRRNAELALFKETGSAAAPAGTTTPTTMPEWVLMGDEGAPVTALQKALGSFYTAKIDGDFGKLTFAAVEAYQASKGLLVDGKAGPVTLGSLGLT